MFFRPTREILTFFGPDFMRSTLKVPLFSFLKIIFEIYFDAKN